MRKLPFKIFPHLTVIRSLVDVPQGVVWLIKVMAALWFLDPRENYRVWIKCHLQFMQPPNGSETAILRMVNNNYLERSV